MMELMNKKEKDAYEEASEQYMRARLWLLSGMARRKVFEALERAIFLDDRYQRIISGDILFKPLYDDPYFKRLIER